MLSTRKCIAGTLALATLLFVNSVYAESWPTFMHDAERSGQSSDKVELPLSLKWSRRIQRAPRPAWGPPAKQDFWHRKSKLAPRVTYDRAFHIVGGEGQLYIGSSADDQLRCFSANDGKLLWKFYAEGPIRLAPTFVDKRVVFGSDDGCVYAVEPSTGKLIWKTRPEIAQPRRIPGNGRIISNHPIRTAILAVGQTGYFTAGLFPNQGVHYFSIDLRDGSILDRSNLDVSPQGYLQRRGAKVFTPTGRNPAGKLIGSLKRRGQPLADLGLLPKQFPYSLIGSQNLRFAGGDGSVAAFEKSSSKMTWNQKVDGKVHGLAIIDGSLFASTSQGMIYCFSNGDVENPIDHTPIQQTDVVKDDSVERAIEQLATRHGYALVIRPPSASAAIALAQQSEMQIVVAVRSEEKAQQFRNRISNFGLYGRIVVHVVTAKSPLPYADHIFDLVLGGNSRSSLQRLLGNQRSMAVLENGETLTGAPRENGEWTHLYADAGNTACSKADVSASGLKLQWFGEPGPRNLVDRHLRSMSPLAVNGRLFVIGLDQITAVNAHNGAILWEREIAGLTRIGILKDSGGIIATKESLMLAIKNECHTLDANTGRTISTRKAPTTDGDWSYLGNVHDVFIGSTCRPGASRRTIQRSAILEGAYTDNRPIVLSDTIFAFKDDQPSVVWHYRSDGVIPNPTLCANSKNLFCIESIKTSVDDPIGRLPYKDILPGSNLIALSNSTGQLNWKLPTELKDGVQSLYLLCNDEYLVVVNSRNDKTVHYDMQVRQVEDGRLVWQQTQDNRDRTGGDHGEQDKHPVIADGKLIVEPFVYDLSNGRMLSELNLSKRGYGCGTISASAKAVFFRSGNPAGFSLETGSIDQICKVSRTGCWINIIPACDYLLIPEGSSGCTCNYAIQASMAFAHR